MSHLPHTPARTPLHSRVIAAAFFCFREKRSIVCSNRIVKFLFVFSFLFKLNRQVLQTNIKKIWMKLVL